MDIWYPPLFETSSLEYQANLILARADNTEQKYGGFCKDFARYSRNVAGVRDLGDRLTENLLKFTESLQDSPSTRATLQEFTSLFLSVQDQEHARVKRLQAKVVPGFSKYGYICLSIKEEIQNSLNIREHEHQQAEEFSKLQAKFIGNFHLHQQRQDNLTSAITATRRAQEMLKKEADKFERQKVNDLQQVLMNFCEIELTYHARAIELYTAAFNAVKLVGPDSDLEHFRKSIVSKVPAAMKSKVGRAAVPVHVASSVKMDGFTHVEQRDDATDGGELSEDTKEVASTTDEDLISEVAHLTPTDRERTTDSSVSDQDKLRTRTAERSKKQRSTMVETTRKRSLKPPKSRTQSLTPDQIRRHANHFGVHTSEYTTDSDYALSAAGSGLT